METRRGWRGGFAHAVWRLVGLVCEGAVLVVGNGRAGMAQERNRGDGGVERGWEEWFG